jgi:hypothetical protein
LSQGKVKRRPFWFCMDAGDVGTLANPEVVEQIRVMVQGEAKTASKTGPEDIRTFGQG